MMSDKFEVDERSWADVWLKVTKIDAASRTP